MARDRKSRTASTARRRPARLLIVDDHPLVRRGLAELIAGEPSLAVCGEAADTATAWVEVERLRPDIMVVDLSLPDGEGLELIKGIRARYPDVRIVVLSMHDEKLYAERALRAGASGYVQKQEPAVTVLEAIREVLAGGVFVSRPMAERILLRVVGHPGAVERPRLETLSDRELEVLDLLGEGLGVRAIAARLRLSEKTIQTHREHLKAKLKLAGPELLRYAFARHLLSGRAASPGSSATDA